MNGERSFVCLFVCLFVLVSVTPSGQSPFHRRGASVSWDPAVFATCTDLPLRSAQLKEGIGSFQKFFLSLFLFVFGERGVTTEFLPTGSHLWPTQSPVASVSCDTRQPDQGVSVPRWSRYSQLLWRLAFMLLNVHGVGRGRESERLDRGNRPKKTGETVYRRQNNGKVKAVSPRHCPGSVFICLFLLLLCVFWGVFSVLPHRWLKLSHHPTAASLPVCSCSLKTRPDLQLLQTAYNLKVDYLSPPGSPPPPPTPPSRKSQEPRLRRHQDTWQTEGDPVTESVMEGQTNVEVFQRVSVVISSYWRRCWSPKRGCVVWGGSILCLAWGSSSGAAALFV